MAFYCILLKAVECNTYPQSKKNKERNYERYLYVMQPFERSFEGVFLCAQKDLGMIIKPLEKTETKNSINNQFT